MTLPGDAAEVTANPTVQAAFEDAFATDIASVLGCAKSRINVTSITAGSVVVEYTVAPADDGTQLTTAAVESAVSAPITFAAIQASDVLPSSVTAAYAAPITATVEVSLSAIYDEHDRTSGSASIGGQVAFGASLLLMCAIHL